MKTAKRIKIPKDFPVQPLKAGQRAKEKCTCGTCGLSWDNGKSTTWTPTPSGRCPFEYFHEEASPRSNAIREFTQHDWHGFAGATSFADGEPLYADLNEPEFMVGKAGAILIGGYEGIEFIECTNDTRSWSLAISLPHQWMARALMKEVMSALHLAPAEETLRELGFDDIV